MNSGFNFVIQIRDVIITVFEFIPYLIHQKNAIEIFDSEVFCPLKDIKVLCRSVNKFGS